MKYGPIILSDRITVSAGQIRQAQSVNLQNPFRAPMLIDEIRYRVAASNSPSGVSDGYWGLRVRHTLGRTPLMSDFIPIGALCRVLGSEGANLSPVSDEVAVSDGWFTWKLPKPLYVPGTEYLNTEVFNSNVPGSVYGSVGSNSFTLEVAYSGKTVEFDAKPKVIAVPWAALYEAPAVPVTPGEFFSNKSSEANLRNPFNELLHVQRFIGRAANSRLFNAFQEFDASTMTERTTVRAADSFGRVFVRDQTPFFHLFTFPSRTWTVNTKLQPKGFFIFEIQRDYTDLVSTNAVENSEVISMIGHREVYYQP